jgi:hypothetical protein
VAGLADQVGDHPMLVSLLNRPELQRQQFAAAETAANQYGHHRVFAELTRRGRRPVEQPPPLVGGEPVPEPDADPTHALHATNARREFRTEQPGIGRLVGNATHGG